MAGRFSIETVFKATDRITAPISRMQNRIGKMTRAMERGLRKINRGVDKVINGFKRAALSMAKFGAGAAAAIGTATVLALNNMADAADALAKRSRRLEFPIEELQQWSFIAEQSGVDTELLNKSLGAFSKRLGEAAGGTGPLVTGLKNINPALLEQLQNTDSVADAFDIYIKAIRNAGSATERAALANAAFSRAGLDLVNIANNSEDAITAMRKQMIENGLVTMEQAEAAEAYNDSLNNLQKALNGLLRGVLLPLLPKLTQLADQFREYVVQNREMIQARVFEFFDKVKRGIKALFNAVVELNQKYNLAEMFLETVEAAASMVRWLKENAGTIKTVGIVVGGFILALKGLVAVLTAINLVMAANPITLWVVGIAAVSAAVVALVNHFGGLENIMATLAIAFMAAWAPVEDFFVGMWERILGAFDFGLSKVAGAIEGVARFTGAAIGGAADFLGLGGAGTAAPQVVSPQERTAKQVNETRTTSTAEVTIRDETNRAALTGGRLGAGVSLVPTGA